MTLQSDRIRKSILDQVEDHPHDIVTVVANEFGISRQAVHRHIKILIEDGVLVKSGTSRKPRYSVVAIEKQFAFPLQEYREEDVVWRKFILPLIGDARQNIVDLCHYSFTEMFNNAIDHSGGTGVLVTIKVHPKKILIDMLDDGIGVFERIRSGKNLPDLQTARLELSKGKMTTDPDRHSGQGIFFTSRMMDDFALLANGLYFSLNRVQDWLLDSPGDHATGTYLKMSISTESDRTPVEVFDQYSTVDYGFTKTHVLLGLARYGQEMLVSRSQAKRVLARFDKFEEINLDFAGVESVGQAFADEIFRVFLRSHPGTKIIAVNTNRQIDGMIKAAMNAG